VALIDKARFPRDKCCGDGLTTNALRHLEALGLQPKDVESWQPVAGARVRAPDGRIARLPLPDDGSLYAASARRVDLDAALVERARREGVAVIEGQPVTGAGAVDDGHSAQVELAGGRILRASYVVAADGMWSPMRKLTGAEEPGYLGEWHAVRQYFTGVGREAARDMWVWFEPDLLPGYVWSFPLPGGGANVGFGIHRHPDQPMGQIKQRWAEILSRPHIREVLGAGAAAEAPWKSWPIPARIGRSALSSLGGRVLFVGDAARATDVMTGEGIGQAFDTAVAASLALDRAGPQHPEVAARDYERDIARGMAVDDRLGRSLSEALSHRRGVMAAIALTGANAWTRRSFARWMFEDYPRALLATPHRWHRRMMSRPGAFASR